ncbi:alpha/beta-type small acid-soluble spore protein [Murimonas intestini]|uniref:Small acid-soluble spore protein alpha/beta type n=1 Tax=Murimonas intestini TaxID=1337051 RepID=A0AB73TB27_9FIRM|nr:alpha/beta-type small acid-soluble spore protein [Murimonas intestini]MCR1838777.1 alpha/beta-type small acid-soluble spore protein [Murimonas intestini]MCR1864077.1 alpha/beta-type small acid-soluble spore protein [Murimonas intestini]MCR1881687.1 alpha/beta-type small acid-soluble spore protein [Murimonas intestini]
MSNRSSNTAAVPEAKGALDRFKFEVANELGVPLTDGYNGNLTSKQNGSVGGYMVKKMIEAQERQMSGSSSMGSSSMGSSSMGNSGMSQI